MPRCQRASVHPRCKGTAPGGDGSLGMDGPEAAGDPVLCAQEHPGLGSAAALLSSCRAQTLPSTPLPDAPCLLLLTFPVDAKAFTPGVTERV